MGECGKGVNKIMRKNENERILKVMDVLLKQDVETDDFNRESMNKVVTALLGREYVETKEEKMFEQGIQTEQINTNKANMNALWACGYYLPIQTRNPIKKIYIKIIRKICAPFLHPIMDVQQEFNASVTRCVNDIVDHAEGKTSVSILQSQVTELADQIDNMKNEKEDELERFKYQEEEGYEDIYPYFENRKEILQLDCGRGGFVEYLQKKGKKAIGVESYVPFIDVARKKGLSVKEDNSIEYIKKSQDCCYDGVFATHYLEKLTEKQVIDLCYTIWDKLRYEGIVVFRIYNPTQKAYFEQAFYRNFANVHPMHPSYLQELLVHVGFSNVEIVDKQDCVIIATK